MRLLPGLTVIAVRGPLAGGGLAGAFTWVSAGRSRSPDNKYLTYPLASRGIPGLTVDMAEYPADADPSRLPVISRRREGGSARPTVHDP